MADFWTVVNGIAAAVAAYGGWRAAVIAKEAIGVSRRDSTRQFTFDQLAELQRLSLEFHAHRHPDVYEELLDCAKQGTAILPAPLALQSLLNAQDLLAFAVLRGEADREIVLEYMRNTWDDSPLTISYLQRLRECFDDPCLYEHLEKLMKQQIADALSSSRLLDRLHAHVTRPTTRKEDKSLAPAAPDTAAATRSDSGLAEARRERTG